MSELNDSMLMDEPIISVVIPTIGRTNMVCRCVRSILDQTVPPNEIIIVDSKRDPKMQSVLSETLLDGEDVIRYVYDPTNNLCEKKNIGVRLSTGDVLIFFDDDVVLDEKYIEEVLKAFRVFPEAVGVTGNIANFGNRDTKSLWSLLTRLFFVGHFGDGDFLPSICPTFVFGIEKTVPTKFLPGGTSAYVREIFNHIGFDENLGRLHGYCFMEDVDFSYRVSKKHMNVYTPAAFLWHYPSWSREKERNPVLMMHHKVDNHFYVFKKNMPRHLSNMFALCISIIGRLVLSLIFERDPRKIIGWVRAVVGNLS